jgi:hypothetical protein
MAYFGECKGTLTEDERRAEADRIIKILAEFGHDGMTSKEYEFVGKIETGDVSPKQLLWLRDIKAKYAE